MSYMIFLYEMGVKYSNQVMNTGIWEWLDTKVQNLQDNVLQQ